MSPSVIINVNLADRSYPIVIGNGLLDDSFDISSYMAGPDCLVVSNVTVAPLYLDRLSRCLGGRNMRSVVLPDGEAHKTLAIASTVLDSLVAMRAARDASVIALGGGVVGDIAGFAAACYMRGIGFIQVPTTLLAQVDSSVGGKTGVNHPEGKNLIGAFHQPRVVVIDTTTLQTLPGRELRAGLAEVIKHGAIADIAFFGWLEEYMSKLLERDGEALAYAIRRSCEIKAAMVAADEREAGQRALLNFGHTFAHAIENSLGYGEWLHGEAVAAGMVMAARLSDIDSRDVDRLRRLIEAAGLPTEPPRVGGNQLRAAMNLDKKAQDGKLRFVLLQALGRAVVTAEYDAPRLVDILSQAA
ncbi:MAG: 3-dehydroquinate synthase [Woeseia sp.]